MAAPKVLATAAAAVLYPPLGSTIMLFPHGADFMAFCVAATTFSTISKLLPLMKTFVCARAFGSTWEEKVIDDFWGVFGGDIFVLENHRVWESVDGDEHVEWTAIFVCV